MLIYYLLHEWKADNFMLKLKIQEWPPKQSHGWTTKYLFWTIMPDMILSDLSNSDVCLAFTGVTTE